MFARKLTLLMIAIAFGFSALSLSACRTKVDRIDIEEVRDVSGRWNDTDSRFVSEEMIRDCMQRTWIDDFSQDKSRKPVVIVGNVLNKSHEHINTETFVKDLERALLNSGRVKTVAAKGERGGVREERDDMAVHSRSETQAASFKETGADFMMIGQVNTILDEKKRRKVAYYQVELEMVSMVNNEKVWIGQKKLKKYIKRPQSKY